MVPGKPIVWYMKEEIRGRGSVGKHSVPGLCPETPLYPTLFLWLSKSPRVGMPFWLRIIDLAP